MEIRRARPGDGPGIGLVHVRSWQTTYKGIVPQEFLDRMDVEKRCAWWTEQIAADTPYVQSLWVAVDESGQIVGFANGGPRRAEVESFTGELYSIYLLQSAQGQGLGRVLMERIVSDLWAAGHRDMVLGALSENPACRFYEHMGGKVVHEERITRGGKELDERFYGWTDLNLLLQ